MLVNHNTVAYKNANTTDFNFDNEWANLYSNLFQYYYQYHLKQRLYLLDQIDSVDLECTHPIFHHKVAYKNKDFTKGLFSFSCEAEGKTLHAFQKDVLKGFMARAMSTRGRNKDLDEQKKLQQESNQMMEFLKCALDKFLPHVSFLWHLNDTKPTAIMILKIIKLLFRYSLLKRRHLVKLMDLLMDKAVILKHLEKLYDNAINDDINYTASSTKNLNKKNEGSPLEGPQLTPLDLKRWSKVLMKFRQMCAEMLVLIVLYNMDDRMFEIMKRNREIMIQFDPFPEEDEEKFTKKDLNALEALEQQVDFEDLGIFEEEQGASLMRIFLGYILNNPLNPPNKLSPKIKAMTRIFLSFFANVEDINLGALKLMNQDMKNIMNRPLFLTDAEAESPENKAICDFVNYCDIHYLTERLEVNSEYFLNDFQEKIEGIYKVLMVYFNDADKFAIQDMLFQCNFLWIMIHLVVKYSPQINGCKDLVKKITTLFDFCLDKNIYFQNTMLQGKFLRLLGLKQDRLGVLGVELVCIAFKKNPILMVSNQSYLNFFFKFCRKNDNIQASFASEAEYYNARSKFYNLLSYFLDEKYQSWTAQIPEYDLISLDNVLSTENTEAAFLDSKNLIEILGRRKEPEMTHIISFVRNILGIIAKASSKRYTKENSKTLMRLFPLNDLRVMLMKVSEDYEIKTDVYRLFRNIYVFEKDNVFDDEEKLYEFVIPVIEHSMSDRNSIVKKRHERETLSQPQSQPHSATEEKKQKPKSKSKLSRAEIRAIREYDAVVGTVREQFEQFCIDIKGYSLMDQRQKKAFTSYGVTMLLSTINFLSKGELQVRIASMRTGEEIRRVIEENEKAGKDAKSQMYFILETLKDPEVDKMLTKAFELSEKDRDIKKVFLYEDIELEPLPENTKNEIRMFDELIHKCEMFSSGKAKDVYKIYNLGTSTDMVKRYSNKLEDRQGSVNLPLEILKTLFLALKENAQFESFGMIMGALYESFKLKKLSTFSSMKKNYETQAADNIYLRILKESAIKKDNLAHNLCQYLLLELGGGLYSSNFTKHLLRQQSSMSSSIMGEESVFDIEGCLIKPEDQDSADFNPGQRNAKYTLLEIFSNVLFHATDVFQEYVYTMLRVNNDENDEEVVSDDKDKQENLQMNTKMLDIIWHELLLNFSFSFHRTRQDKLWKEMFMRTILLIKFHQYLCEENNAKFKKVFNVCKVKTLIFSDKGNITQEETRYSHINNIMNHFWTGCDWSKKNFILIKKGFMFPVAQAFVDFLNESMCGPFVDNQILITNMVALKPLSSFLDTFEPSIHQIIGKGSQSEVVYDLDKIKNVYVIDVRRMNELKLSICDFFLTCCEGNNKKILENQLKKINYNEVLETVVKLIKALIFKFSHNKQMNYDEYRNMRKVYKSSGFNEDQTMVLYMALKLFIYLKTLEECSYTLKHLLENKTEIASSIIKEIKMEAKLNRFRCGRRKTEKSKGDEDEPEEDERDEKDFEDGLCLKFLGSFSKRLEVITEEPDNEQEQKEFLFFEPNPKFSFLSEETKEHFISDVDRTNHESKLHGLITSCTYFEEEISIAERIRQTYPNLSIWFNTYKDYEIAIFLLCCLTNLFIVMDYSTVEGSDKETDMNFHIIIQVFGSLVCVSSAILLVLWLKLRFPIEKRLEVLMYCERRGCKVNNISNYKMYEIIMMTLNNENLVRVLLLHIFCAIMGLTMSRGFYAVEILTIVNLFATFKYLAKSISLHWHQLLFTLFMVLIFIYIYSVFSNMYFRSNLEEQGYVCNGMIQCYFALLNTGFTNGQGIADMLSAENMNEELGKYFGYVFIDLMFFITVNCISLNLVFGIIVDTFGELREQNERYGELNLGILRWF